jgi:hypothetical protein
MENSQQNKPKGYPAKTSGGLWNHQKASPSHPDVKGFIEVTHHQIKQLVAMAKSGQEPKIQLGAWNGAQQAPLAAQPQAQAEPAPANPFGDFDDDVPF